MVTDLVQVRLLGEKKLPENERFRRYLKTHDHSDRILRRVAQDVQEQIDCTACANCCRVAAVEPSQRDVERLARYLRLTPAQFLEQYTAKGEEGEVLLRRTEDHGCVFLEGNNCTVYEACPDTCRRFPHVVRGNGSIASRMWQLIDRACYCPIVYNAMEEFKAVTRFRSL